MNKKGITPIIAVVLLLMMTVAAAGAAFYWLTRMQQTAQAGVTGQQQQILDQSSASLAVVSQTYTNTNNAESLAIDVQNTGGKTLSRAAGDIIGVLEDGNGNTVCSSAKLSNSNTTASFYCSSGCGNSDTLAPGAVKRLTINIDDCIDDYTGGSTSGDLDTGVTYYYQFKFQKGAIVSGSITG